MPNRFSFRIFGFLFLTLGFWGIPRSAQAGFQWVAPSAPVETMPAPTAPAPVAAQSAEPTVVIPEATGKPEILSPVVSENADHTASTSDLSGPIVIQGTPRPSPPMPASPSLPLSSSASSSPSPSPSPSPSSSSSDAVHGFANHVPLAVALRQILPQGYGFSVDQDVDLGVLVSFSGGKPWRDTLKEALMPAGLIVREQGQMVSIGYPASREMALAPATGESAMAKPKPLPQGHFLSLPPEMAPIGDIPPTIITGKSADMSSKLVLQSWDAERGDSLRKIVEMWAHRADVETNWMSEYDYPLQASVHFTGTFEDAVRNLLLGFEAAHPQPVAELHSNSQAGQTVLVVTTRGNVGE
jgi:hypothetical protein